MHLSNYIELLGDGLCLQFTMRTTCEGLMSLASALSCPQSERRAGNLMPACQPDGRSAWPCEARKHQPMSLGCIFACISGVCLAFVCPDGEFFFSSLYSCFGPRAPCFSPAIYSSLGSDMPPPCGNAA